MTRRRRWIGRAATWLLDVPVEYRDDRRRMPRWRRVIQVARWMWHERVLGAWAVLTGKAYARDPLDD